MNLNFLLSAFLVVTLHEASHVLAAWTLAPRSSGSVCLGADRTSCARPARRGCVVISLAGPLANLLTLVVCLLVGHCANLCFSSFVLGAFNLLPIPASDGLRAATLLWRTTAKTPQLLEIQRFR